MLQRANSTGKAVAKTKLADIKSKNARASLANITMLLPPDTTWRRGWSFVQLLKTLKVVFFYFLFYLVAYLSSYHEKAINALYELA